MHLDSALELQTETLRLIYDIGAKNSRVFPAYSTSRLDPWPYPEDISIGLSRKSEHDFQLAIRVQGTTETSPLVNRIFDRARGEAEVRWIGGVTSYQGSRAGWQKNVSSPLMIGCSVSGVHTPCGTLGCFVRQRNDPSGLPHVLSCSHIIAQLGMSKLGENIIQPASSDCGLAGHRVVANLSGTSRPDISRTDNVVDAAFGVIESTLQIDPMFLWPGDKLVGMEKIDHNLLNQEVFKIGRSSDRTIGHISAINVANLKMSFGGTPYIFSSQFEVTSDRGPFAIYGDSGSLVVSKTSYALGLIMGGGYHAGRSTVYANPLSEVMDGLGLNLIV
jgi:Peptidase family S64